MASIDEAVDKYVAAIKSMDIGTLMATLTPEALGKAMAMQGQTPPPVGIPPGATFRAAPDACFSRRNSSTAFSNSPLSRSASAARRSAAARRVVASRSSAWRAAV